MTTKVTIANDPTSNGDVILNGVNTTEGRIKDAAIRPGESRELWITTSSMLTVHETWPTRPKNASGDDGGGTIIRECGDNGEAWAKAFVNQFPAADEDTMRAWFQNAIEAADTVRRERRVQHGDEPKAELNITVDPALGEFVPAAELTALRDKAWKYDELSK